MLKLYTKEELNNFVVNFVQQLKLLSVNKHDKRSSIMAHTNHFIKCTSKTILQKLFQIVIKGIVQPLNDIPYKCCILYRAFSLKHDCHFSAKCWWVCTKFEVLQNIIAEVLTVAAK